MQTIKLQPKNVFGRDLFYPECQLAKKLAIFQGSKTFTEFDLKQLKEMGFKLEFVAGVPEFLETV